MYGSPNWTRTSDKLINSQLLYQLSYRGTLLVEKAYSKAVNNYLLIIS